MGAPVRAPVDEVPAPPAGTPAGHAGVRVDVEDNGSMNTGTLYS